MQKAVSLRAFAAVVLVVSSWSASANTLGFVSDLGMAQNSPMDPLLSPDDITELVRNSLGNRVKQGISPAGTVSLEGQHLYVPDASNMRVLTLNLSIYRNVNADGKKVMASVCGMRSHTWRAGPSVQAHVSALKDATTEFVRTFIARCMN